jgi:exopolyphosphatase / guanosine-5'-triphosphate,3'-diphosphate pyrophosphatase
MNKQAAPGAPLAAVDIGSNSFRVEIAQLARGEYKRIEYLKETVRLGAGLDAEGQLSEEAIELGLACLRRFAARLADFTPPQVRAVATQTLREARNRDNFLSRAQAALGFPVEVIPGREEARLIYAGVASLQPSAQKRLVIDIGGRSTELILGQGRTPLAAESFAVGCVSLSMRYFPQGRITEAGFRAAQVAAGAEFEEGLKTFARPLWKQALGSSGTAGAVSQVLAAAGVSDGRITPEGLRWCITQCLKAGHIDALQLPSLRDDRRAVIPGGLAILYTLAVHFDIQELFPAKGALRQGVIFDLTERREAWRHANKGDARDGAVAALQSRFTVDVAQAQRVTNVALGLFDALRPEADAEARRELQWACALHECGLTVSHHDHHRHSAYLVANVDAAGFAQGQQQRLADLVLGQRGGLRKIEGLLAQDSFAAQVLCLRLAAIKCHARGDFVAGAWRLRQRNGRAILAWPVEWAEDNPRTMHLLHEEAGHWARGAPFPLVLTSG